MGTIKLSNAKFTFEAAILKERIKDVDDGLQIEGVAVSEITSRNGIKYVAEELKSMKTMASIPILDSHRQESIRDIKGIVTEDWYDDKTKSRMFKGTIKDKDAADMIKQGLVSKVSIGAMAKELVKETKESATSYIAKGLEVLELSLVSVAGVATATFTHSMTEAFKTLEGVMENTENDVALKAANDAKTAAEAKARELEERLRKMDEASKADDAAKKDLSEKLEAIEKEKHKEMASKLTEKMVELGFVKEDAKAAELEKYTKLGKESLAELYEKVGTLKKESSAKPETEGRKGRLSSVNSLEEVESGELIVERFRDGASIWMMPKEDTRINRSDKYGLR